MSRPYLAAAAIMTSGAGGWMEAGGQREGVSRLGQLVQEGLEAGRLGDEQDSPTRPLGRRAPARTHPVWRQDKYPEFAPAVTRRAP